MKRLNIQLNIMAALAFLIVLITTLVVTVAAKGQTSKEAYASVIQLTLYDEGNGITYGSGVNLLQSSNGTVLLATCGHLLSNRNPEKCYISVGTVGHSKHYRAYPIYSNENPDIAFYVYVPKGKVHCALLDARPLSNLEKVSVSGYPNGRLAATKGSGSVIKVDGIREGKPPYQIEGFSGKVNFPFPEGWSGGPVFRTDTWSLVGIAWGSHGEERTGYFTKFTSVVSFDEPSGITKTQCYGGQCMIPAAPVRPRPAYPVYPTPQAKAPAYYYSPGKGLRILPRNRARVYIPLFKHQRVLGKSNPTISTPQPTRPVEPVTPLIPVPEPAQYDDTELKQEMQQIKMLLQKLTEKCNNPPEASVNLSGIEASIAEIKNRLEHLELKEAPDVMAAVINNKQFIQAVAGEVRKEVEGELTIEVIPEE